MKSKVFKFVLPAFAFMLAIVASFAFTPTEIGEDAAPQTAYILNTSGPGCLITTQTVDDCSPINAGQTCSVTVTPNPFAVDAYNNSCQLLRKP